MNNGASLWHMQKLVSGSIRAPCFLSLPAIQALMLSALDQHDRSIIRSRASAVTDQYPRALICPGSPMSKPLLGYLEVFGNHSIINPKVLEHEILHPD